MKKHRESLNPDIGDADSLITEDHSAGFADELTATTGGTGLPNRKLVK